MSGVNYASAAENVPARPVTMRLPLTGYLLVMAAAAMWGFIGVFYHTLFFRFGFSALTIGFVRAFFSGLALAVFLAVWRPSLLRAPRRLLLQYALFGLLGVALFYFLNTQSVILTNLATASVLMYTAPVFVTLFAWRLWNEPLTSRKLLAVTAAFIGSALVARAYDVGQLQVNGLGLVVGVASGLAYALFTLGNKSFSARAAPLTTVTYSLFFGGLFLLPLQFINLPFAETSGLTPLVQNSESWLYVLGLCLGPTLGSFFLFSAGLRSVPASSASVVATIEPVIAGLAGYFILGQQLEPLQLVGAAIVIAAALSLTLSAHSPAPVANTP